MSIESTFDSAEMRAENVHFLCGLSIRRYETFIEETQDAKVVIARIETEIGRLKEDISSLNITIRDGNGRPPLTTRIAVVEERIAEVKEKIESMETESAEEKKMRWEFLLAAIPGILALLL